MPHLAVNGGSKVRNQLFPGYKPIGNEEEKAAAEVIRSGILSRFLGCCHDDFLGGPQVRALEKEWADYYQVKHAIAVNSATSGLYCAMGASGVGPGDEVIVSPYTMTASAAAVLVYNAIPVFADIEEDCFCLDPESVKIRISPRTRAIVVVDIFGQPYDAGSINELAREHNLLVIEDAAQAPGVRHQGKYAGTLGDIGVFSLNYHKHIHCGEGGIIVTDNDELADRVRLIRNHGEAVLQGMGRQHLVNMLGFNFRMTEVEAAIAREQLKKLAGLIKQRQDNVAYLETKLAPLEFLKLPRVRPGCEHAYYLHALKYIDGSIPRSQFAEAVKAELTPSALREHEGVLMGCGYTRPLYLQPMYQQTILYGENGCPFRCPHYKGQADYSPGICPVCENLYNNILITHELMRPPASRQDLDDVARAFKKVWQYRDELR